MQKSRVLKLAALFILLNLFIFAEENLEDYLKNNDDEKMQKELLITKAKKNSVLDENTGEVIYLKGQACVIYGKEKVWKQIAKGAAIKEGATILTFENSEIAIKLPNGTEINLKQKTKALIENLRKGKVKEVEVSETGIALAWGTVYSSVAKMVNTGSKFEVKSGSCVAGVRGTKFAVTGDKEGNGKVTVYEGIVNLASDKIDKNIDIYPNEKASFDKSGDIKDKEIHNEQPIEIGKNLEVKKDKYDLDKIYEVKPIVHEDSDVKEEKEFLNNGEKSQSLTVGVR